MVQRSDETSVHENVIMASLVRYFSRGGSIRVYLSDIVADIYEPLMSAGLFTPQAVK